MHIQIHSYSPPTLHSHRRFFSEAQAMGWQLEFLNPDHFLEAPKNADIHLLRIGNLNYHEAFEKFSQFPKLHYINSIVSFQQARNKWSSYKLLHQHVAMPLSSLSALPTPCLLKLSESSQGRGVFLLQNEFDSADLQKQLKESYFFQEFISEAQGNDYRIMMIGQNYIGAIHRQNKSNFKANIHQGGVAQAWTAPSDLIFLCQKIMASLGLHYAGLDFIKNAQGEFLFIEANPSPGFEAFEGATEINFAKELLESLNDRP